MSSTLLFGSRPIDAASGKEVRGILRSAHDLEQYRDIWGCEGFTINIEFARVLSMGESQVPTCERRAFTDERNIQIDVDVNASAGCGLGLGFSNKMKHSEVTYNRCRLQHLVK